TRVDVPAATAPLITPTVKVRLTYEFATATNSSQLLASVDGSTWTVNKSLDSNISGSTTTTKTISVGSGANQLNFVADTSAAQPIYLCLEGRKGGGTMSIDQVRVDVEE